MTTITTAWLDAIERDADRAPAIQIRHQIKQIIGGLGATRGELHAHACVLITKLHHLERHAQAQRAPSLSDKYLSPALVIYDQPLAKAA